VKKSYQQEEIDMNALVCTNTSKVFKRWQKIDSNGKPYLLGRFKSSISRRREKIRAVDDISFNVDKGEIFGIVGPNGSGKSTLIRLICTLLLPDSGSIEVFGRDVVKEHFQVRQIINRVSVEASFFKKLSSLENLMYAARLYGVDSALAKRKAVDILSRLGFKEDRVTESMQELSRGMQQKVAIARALLTSPSLLLMDEPTTGLDPRSKRDVQKFVKEIREQQDTTVVITSHDMDEVDNLCDRVAIIDNGKFMALDTPIELKRLAGSDLENISLEDVFMKLTGKELEEADK
jgi:ABC-2 type transport system ATP-binding protein